MPARFSPACGPNELGEVKVKREDPGPNGQARRVCPMTGNPGGSVKLAETALSGPMHVAVNTPGVEWEFPLREKLRSYIKVPS